MFNPRNSSATYHYQVHIFTQNFRHDFVVEWTDQLMTNNPDNKQKDAGCGGISFM